MKKRLHNKLVKLGIKANITNENAIICIVNNCSAISTSRYFRDFINENK